MRPREVLTTLKLEDGRRWIDAAHDWQQEDALAILEGERPYNFLTRSRGSSKTTDLAAICLSSIAAGDVDRMRCFWFASDSEQAGLAVDAISGFVQRTPSLLDRVQVQTRRVIVPEFGSELAIMAADAAGAWGLTPHLVVCDELANWNDTDGMRRLWEAVSSAVAKRTGAKLVVLTTPSTPEHFAYRILEAARGSDMWRVTERIGPSPWIGERELGAQRRQLPASKFKQLFMGEWTRSEGSFLEPSEIDAAFILDGPAHTPADMPDVHGPWVAAMDLGVVKDRTVVSIGHLEGEVVVLDRMRVWSPSPDHPVDLGDVERFIVSAHAEFGFQRLLADPWQSLDMCQRLRAQGLEVEEYTFSMASKQRLAATLLSSLRAGNLALYPEEGLREELLGLRLVQGSAGQWSFDHKSGAHDDMAVSLSLMAVGLLEDFSGPFVMAAPRVSRPGLSRSYSDSVFG